jgi:hypothetical protein
LVTVTSPATGVTDGWIRVAGSSAVNLPVPAIALKLLLRGLTSG